MIRDWFGACHVARLLSGKERTPVNRVFVQSAKRPVLDLIRRFRNFSTTSALAQWQRGTTSGIEVVPRSCALYHKWQHMPPRDLERTPCRHPCGTRNPERNYTIAGQNCKTAPGHVSGTLGWSLSHFTRGNLRANPAVALVAGQADFGHERPRECCPLVPSCIPSGPWTPYLRR